MFILGPQPILMFTDRYQLRRMTTDGDHSTSLRHTRSANHIAVDYHNKMVFWADTAYRKIYSASTEDPLDRKNVIADVEKPEGLAVDPVGGKVYWVDAGKFGKLHMRPPPGTSS